MSSFGDKVVYQIYPRSFYDTDGDGIGDLRGIIARLDYLKDLGTDYIWITPFFVSPQRDNGYDIADYRKVDERFGTMSDFEELSRQAHDRGIGIMLDMVFNHTSTEHTWFQKALAGDRYYQDYYKFVDGTPDAPPTNWQSKFGGSAWEYVESLGKWYLHLFDVTQADLNWDNVKVREELKDIVRFWKRKGVNGFRFDVINLVSKPEILQDDTEGDGRRFYTDGPRIHEYLKELVRDTGIEDMITVGEMSSTTLENCIRYSNPGEKELSMVFSFHHLKVDYKNGDKWALKPADLMELKQLLKTWQEGMSAAGGWNAVFWTNHDQPRTISRFGDEDKYWKQSGKLFAGIIHLMRGTPYVYQGEEIGMLNAHYGSISDYRDVESLNYYEILKSRGLSDSEALHVIDARSRDNGRTPMQWDKSENFGFTRGTPWIKVPECSDEVTVEAEVQDEDSILNFYKKLIALRKEMPIIADGDISFDTDVPEQVICYKRTLGNRKMIIYGNLSGEEVNMPLSGIQTEDIRGCKIILRNYTAGEGDASEQKKTDRILSEKNIKLCPYEFLVFSN